jgi:hypothetical protein
MRGKNRDRRRLRRTATTLNVVSDEVRAGQFVCGFCGLETTDDPRYIRIDLSWAHSIATQSLGAHHACLIAALKPGFPLAVEGTE